MGVELGMSGKDGGGRVRVGGKEDGERHSGWRCWRRWREREGREVGEGGWWCL